MTIPTLLTQRRRGRGVLLAATGVALTLGLLSGLGAQQASPVRPASAATVTPQNFIGTVPQVNRLPQPARRLIAPGGEPVLAPTVFGPTTARAGDLITLTAGARNDGSGPAFNVHLEVDSNMSLVALDSNGASCSQTPQAGSGVRKVVDCTLAEVAAGTTGVIDLQLQVPATAAPGSYVSTFVHANPEQTTLSIEQRTTVTN